MPMTKTAQPFALGQLQCGSNGTLILHDDLSGVHLEKIWRVGHLHQCARVVCA